MRAKRATSIGVVSAALLLPLVSVAPAAGAPPAGAPAAGASAEQASRAAESVPRARNNDQVSQGRVAGGTQSLPFAPGPATRVAGGNSAGSREIGARTVRPYSLLGVVWEHASDQLNGHVQVRTRDAATKRWSEWRELDSHPGDVPGGEVPESADGEMRGATTPLWVGASDGVQARVLLGHESGGQQNAQGLSASAQPDGLRLDLIDPGPEPTRAPAPGHSAKGRDSAPGPVASSDGSASPAGHPPTGGSTGSDGRGEQGAGAGHKPEPGRAPDSGQAPGPGAGSAGESAAAAKASGGAALPALTREATRTEYRLKARPYIGPRPRIVTRKGWGANERLRESKLGYTKSVKVAFVHHTAMSNDYTCSQSPSIIRAMYRYHVKSSKWRDIGYNFLVDKCGTVYEGRAGGVAKPVMGAHTYGFNTNSTGIAVLGSFERRRPPAAAIDAVSRLTAWKLGLFGRDPKGKVWMTSGGGKYKKGKKVRLRTISGHRDGFTTACPGARLYGKLGATRASAARMQGR
ncbi:MULTISPECIES: N-acetylmuramoyl-L-alanine amidase [unclassified Streptomyces]|uniref:peptidoglycan recognition protein family protein n=1 Tax=unclassified Streptomyces TaxID=2593676 RepID=UPI002DD912E4|nr:MULTISPECIES: N-acetylmuramoyl-L-alanine amidase [unclassified Streptomyces]WSA94356.1 N-acetylmuramoyl-L-alanine amidase [Streptomyces sp. NBC_01795]WSB78774.1 N-acetylmuramoyl-L-alanine amidase [Streptomyces sp. NBC_01775]WSS13022.1 N-acetylmuramoyl-L-alanine amidase [Streptomyces sp. NBC_01186]WSS41806.1 N-acetylmuramoyl-L-alanine amidase [Streptomyces sp. NBC_01187]